MGKLPGPPCLATSKTIKNTKLGEWSRLSLFRVIRAFSVRSTFAQTTSEKNSRKVKAMGKNEAAFGVRTVAGLRRDQGIKFGFGTSGFFSLTVHRRWIEAK